MLQLTIHDIEINLSFDTPELEEFFSDYFYFLRRPGESKKRGELQFQINTVSEHKEPYLMSSYVSQHGIQMVSGERFAEVNIDLKKGLVEVNALPFTDKPLEVIFEFVLMQPLHFALKYWGFFMMHASAMALDEEHGVLFLGEPHAGKSTMVLNLLRHGYYYIAEESPILCKRDGHVRLYSFPEKIGLKKKTLENFSEYAPFCQGEPTPYLKHRVAVENLYPGKVLKSCKPKTVFFPQYRHDCGVEISPMKGIQALVEITRRELVSYQYGEAINFSREHTEALSELVEQCHFYHLYYSDDRLSDVAETITEYLESA